MRKNQFVAWILVLALMGTATSCTSKESDGKLADSEETQTEEEASAETGTEETGTEETGTEETEPEETDQEEPGESGEADKERIMAEFNGMVSAEDVELSKVILFMQENMKSVGEEHGTAMVLRLEELQTAKQLELEEKFYGGTIQEAFLQSGLGLEEVNLPELIQNSELKALVVLTKESGYKIEMAEGSCFPVIDYSIYQQFGSYTAMDIRDYIDIMAVESGKRFARDAALGIGWDEVVERAILQEAFLKNYPDSAKTATVRELFERYEHITMNGLDNTPLFDSEGPRMLEEVKHAYTAALELDRSSKYLDKLKAFMKIVAENDYMLTPEVKAFIQAN